MSHMVIYRTNSGTPGFHQAETINEAIAYVERLRNAEGVETARIYRLEQVDFSFEPVYKVRVDDADLSGSHDAMPPRSMAGTQAAPASARMASEPPIANPMGTTPGNPPSLQGPMPPPTGQPMSEQATPPGPAVADTEEDGDARRGLFGR